MLVHIIFLILFIVIIVQPIYAQQASMVWDETSKSWVSTPTAPATPTITTPQPQQQQPQIIQQPTTTTVPTAAVVTPAQSTVDLGTLMTVITPILAGIAGVFVKNRKDMEKKTEETKSETIKAIEAAIVPKLKQITPVAEQTAKQSVQLNQLAEELYKMMAEKADTIHDKPEIQQQTLIEDAVKSKIIAEQTKQEQPSMTWDEKTKSWISK
jgi:hypothetical protein